jgi:hypothetical protein
MMDQKMTEDLTQALGRWVTQAASELEPDALNALQQCIEIADADVRIVVNLREGAIELQGVAKSAGKYTTLYRQQVDPLRPPTGFAEPQSKGGH